MQDQIERDLKAAMLAGDKQKTEILRGIKNAILYETVALGAKGSGLSEEQIQKVLARESKKRTEAAELYKSVNEEQREAAELAEKEVIDGYLPQQVGEVEIREAVEAELSKYNDPQQSDMGKIIGPIRQKFGVSADGALIARLVVEALGKK